MNAVLFLNYSDGIFDHCSWRNWSSFLALKITMTFILTMSIIYKCISKHLNITKKFICFCTFIQKMMDYNSWKSEVHYLKLVEYFRSKKDLESNYVHFLKGMFTCSFSTWTMLCFQDLLHECSVTWRWSVCGTAEVLLKPWLAWWCPSAHLCFCVGCLLSSFWQYAIDSLWDSCQARRLAIQAQQ